MYLHVPFVRHSLHFRHGKHGTHLKWVSAATNSTLQKNELTRNDISSSFSSFIRVYTRLTFTLEILSTPWWPAHTDKVVVALVDYYHNLWKVGLGGWRNVNSRVNFEWRYFSLISTLACITFETTKGITTQVDIGKTYVTVSTRVS